MSQKAPAALEKSLSQHAKFGELRDELHSLPSCIAERLAGKAVQVLKFPLSSPCLNREEVNTLCESPAFAHWRGAEFQIGRAPVGAEYCAARHALFESFAPAERALAPVYRFSIRFRVATLRGDAVPVSADVRAIASETASSTLTLVASPMELDSVLRAYVDDIPESVASMIGQRDKLVGPSGRFEPIGVIAGMAFATVTRAPYAARLK